MACMMNDFLPGADTDCHHAHNLLEGGMVLKIWVICLLFRSLDLQPQRTTAQQLAFMAVTCLCQASCSLPVMTVHILQMQ